MAVLGVKEVRSPELLRLETTAAISPALAPAVVIDTNSVLDWLLFHDTRVQPLGAAVQAGAVRWVVCARMHEEFARVLRYQALAKWQPDSQRLLADFAGRSALQADPASHPTLRCTDPDDQVFIDLAIATHARWLVSHDRALLRLARLALCHGLTIVQPGRWSMTDNPQRP